MRFDVHSDIGAKVMIGAAALSADNTPPAVDLDGFGAAEILLNVGIGGITFSGTNKIEFKLTHSDDDSSYVAVTDDDMLGVTGGVGTGGIIKSLIAEHAAAAAYRFGYIGGKRYLKLLADFSGTHGSGTPLAATVAAMRPALGPVADQA